MTRRGHAGAAVVLVLALAGCAPNTDTPHSTSPPARSDGATLRSLPEGDNSDEAPVPIEPGTYLVPSSAWSVADYTVTFPRGWTVFVGHDFLKNPDRADEFGFYAVVVDEVYANACRGDQGEVVTVGPDVQDLVDALLEQPGTVESDPVDTTLGGFPAVRIDLRIAPRLDHRNCFLGPGTGVQVWHSRPTDKYFVLLPDEVVSVYVVDVDGMRQVFLAGGFPRSVRDRAERQSVIDSISIKPDM